MSVKYQVEFLGGGVTHYLNVSNVASFHRRWVVEQYIDGMPQAPFEVKIGFHNADEERSEWANSSEVYTWSQVIVGSITVTVTFKTVNGEESITCGPGEACYPWNAVQHKWVVDENGTHVLTVRTTGRKLQQWVKETSLEDAAHVLTALSEKIRQHRLTNNGFVPLSLFNALNKAQGVYTANEVFVWVDGCIALRVRGADEDGWQGQYHLPGCTVTPSDDSLERLAKDAGVSLSVMNSAKQLLGTIVHDEPYRVARCRSTQFEIHLKSSTELEGEWKLFSIEEIRALSARYSAGEKDLEVIDHHVAMILCRVDKIPGHVINLADHFNYIPRIY